jgi:hypothetical protein
MKNNTSIAKNYLIQAIKNMPSDFALSEARVHLNFALKEIEKTEKKRAKRGVSQPGTAKVAKIAESSQSQVARQPIAQPWSQQQIKGVINYIDGLIQQEQKKIDEIKIQKDQEFNKQLDQIHDDSDPTLLQD